MFRSTPEFDEAVRAGFAADHDAAVSGVLTDWENAPLSALAPALPMMGLLPALPVPAIAAVPVSVRFSTLAPSV